LLAAREGDVALVEEVIDVRRQQQAVRAIESLRVGRISPRLDVTGLRPQAGLEPSRSERRGRELRDALETAWGAIFAEL
jgi:hypothetical protein